ncbi:hypothetical protein Scep_012706 [Stephania cephalantha]|uniref:DUF4283 domain-containing protein n=1 Tax=Stephania cephalantha TaxID=152367 RepID=A0AAP0P6X9_9MAGN
MPVWVRFPVLPLEYYEDDILEGAGELLGHFVKINHTTMNVARCSFARICIEINLELSLIPYFQIDD